MDLYADLPDAAGTSEIKEEKSISSVGGWAQTRHAQMLAAKRNAASTNYVHRPGALKVPLEKQIDVKEPSPPPDNVGFIEAYSNVDSGFQDIVISDPYHPARPNDYMAFCRYRIDKNKQEERNKELREIMAEQELERKRLEAERFETASALSQNRTGNALPSDGSSNPPPQGRGRGVGRGNISNLPAWLTKKQQDSSTSQESPGKNLGDTVPGQFESDDNNLAAKIMGKMGWEEGKGLGRSNQGISQPIVAHATGAGTGTVQLHPSDRSKSSETAPKKRGLFSNPTCILLMKNMVGPGDVDPDLEEEVKEECLRFGPIRKCLVKEHNQLPDDEAVWTFVAFEKQQSAVNAYLDMNGRYFGGRQIVASFYDEAKFDRGELSP